MVADRSFERRVSSLEFVEDSALSDFSWDLELNRAIDFGETTQVRRQYHLDHDSVCTSTDSTGGKSRTKGSQLSPESADP